MTNQEIRELLLRLPKLTKSEKANLKRNHKPKFEKIVEILHRNNHKIYVDIDDPLTLKMIIEDLKLEKVYDAVIPTWTNHTYEFSAPGAKSIDAVCPIFISHPKIGNIARITTLSEYYVIKHLMKL